MNKKTSSQPELRLQQECYVWWHNTYPEHRGKLWRVENERRRNRYEQMIAKSTGLVAGVADLNMLHGGQFYAIELKSPEGRQTVEQRAWQRRIEAEGGVYVIVRSLEQFQTFIEEVLS